MALKTLEELNKDFMFGNHDGDTPESKFEPVYEPVSKPLYTPKYEPVFEPVFEPKFEPISEPVFEPRFEPISEPVFEPRFEPISEPVFEPKFEPISEPTFEPSYEPLTFEPKFDPISELAFEPKIEPVSEPIYEPTFEPINEPVYKTKYEPVCELKYEPAKIAADVFDIEDSDPTAAWHLTERSKELLMKTKTVNTADKRFTPIIDNSQHNSKEKKGAGAYHKRLTPAGSPLWQSPKKKRSSVAIISDTLFYLAILFVLIITTFAGSNNGTPIMIFGYADFTVLSSSMEGEIPKGSFILVHKTDPQELQVGDNITFMRDASTSVTHKIISIFEDYQNSGARGFQTKGVHNANPDKEVVLAEKIVGKVILVLPGLGALLLYLRTNIHLVFIMFVLAMILSFSLRGLFAKSKKCPAQEEPKDSYKAAAYQFSVARTAKEKAAVLHK